MQTSFLPSLHGFKFDNSFVKSPLTTIDLPLIGPVKIGNASYGICGGMVHAARDYFEAGLPIPQTKEAPKYGTPLFKYLVNRLIDSFDLPAGPLHYYQMMCMSDQACYNQTFFDNWPKIRRELNKGRLVTLGVNYNRSFNPLRMGENHQVLAYGWREVNRWGGSIEIAVYDPNWSMCDTSSLFIHTRSQHITDNDGAVRGFFPTVYRPSKHPRPVVELSQEQLDALSTKYRPPKAWYDSPEEVGLY